MGNVSHCTLAVVRNAQESCGACALRSVVHLKPYQNRTKHSILYLAEHKNVSEFSQNVVQVAYIVPNAQCNPFACVLRHM
jgi:hypothetical protein